MTDSERDIADAAPTSVAHLVGQRAVVEQVKIALDAAHTDGKPFDHALLVGPPGVGKTQVAQVIAAEMAADYHELLAQAVRTPADLHAVLLRATDRAVVLLDEAHELPRPIQTALYLALDRRAVLAGGGGGRTPYRIPVADFTLLLATTDEHRLLPPLRDRMRLTLRFGYYDGDDLVLLLARRYTALGWWVDVGVLHQIARRSRGTPRLALRLLRACRRVARADGSSRILPAHCERACELEGLDDLGLGPSDRQYLRAVAGGAGQLHVIACRVGLPARTVAEVTEPFLLRVGLVEKDDRGRRHLTAAGRDHLSRAGGEIGPGHVGGPPDG